MSEHAAVLERKKTNNTSSAGSILQRTAIRSHSVESVPPIVHEVLRSPGQPLDRETRESMESRLRYDFSQVRVHTDNKPAKSAKMLNSKAYTVGSNLIFSEGNFNPKTTVGRRLLAHELTHVVQHRSSKDSRSRGLTSKYEQSECEARAVEQAFDGNYQIPTIIADLSPSTIAGEWGDLAQIDYEVYARYDPETDLVSFCGNGADDYLTEYQGFVPVDKIFQRSELTPEVVHDLESVPNWGETPRTSEPVIGETTSVERFLRRPLHPFIRRAQRVPPGQQREQIIGSRPTPPSRTEPAIGAEEETTTLAEAEESAESVQTVPLNVTYVRVGESVEPSVLPGILGGAGQAISRFYEPLPARGTSATALTRFIGPSQLRGFLEPSRFGLIRELVPRLFSEPWTPEIESFWFRQGLSRAELLELSGRLRVSGFSTLMANGDPILLRVVRAHAEGGLVRGSPLLSLTELTPEEALAGRLPPVATRRAYVVRVQIDPRDVGRVNEILGRTQRATTRLASELEVVVAQDLTGGRARITSITPNPSGPLGGGVGTALRWGGRGLAVIGAGTAIYQVVTAEGPHRREIQGRAFGSFALGTIMGAAAVGFCIGAGIATGGLGLVLCGLIAGGAGVFGGDAIGGAIGRQFD